MCVKKIIVYFVFSFFLSGAVFSQDVGFTKQEEKAILAKILKNPTEYRMEKIREFKDFPFFYFVEYGKQEGEGFGEILRIYFEVDSEGIVSGLIKFQSLEMGSISFFSEKVSNNIPETVLSRLSSKKYQDKKNLFKDCDKYFVHIFEIKGSLKKDGELKFQSNKVSLDNNFRKIQYSFKGILNADKVKGVLHEKHVLSYAEKPYLSTLRVDSLIYDL